MRIVVSTAGSVIPIPMVRIVANDSILLPQKTAMTLLHAVHGERWTIAPGRGELKCCSVLIEEVYPYGDPMENLFFKKTCCYEECPEWLLECQTDNRIGLTSGEFNEQWQRWNDNSDWAELDHPRAKPVFGPLFG